MRVEHVEIVQADEDRGYVHADVTLEGGLTVTMCFTAPVLTGDVIAHVIAARLQAKEDCETLCVTADDVNKLLVDHFEVNPDEPQQ